MKEKLPFYIIRALFILMCAGIGIYGAYIFTNEGSLLQFLFYACGIGVLVIAVEMLCSNTDISTLSSIVFGLVMGLVLSVLFSPVIRLISETFGEDLDDRKLHFLQLVSVVLFCYFGVTILLHTRGMFKFIVPYVEFRKEVKDNSPLFLDTSVLIDGRIKSFLESGIINCRVIIPSFVVGELHALSDSSNILKRKKGRRGLAFLNDLRSEGKIDLLPSEAAPGEVDVNLLKLAEDHLGWVLTTDFNLESRGKVQGIKVVNLNNIAEAMKFQVVPGEILKASILRKGDAKGQGVAFLPEGTMIIIEDGEELIGKEVEVEVTSMIKTSAGKMIFAKLKGKD